MAKDGKDEEQAEIKEHGTVNPETADSESARATRARARESDTLSAEDLDKRQSEISARRRTGGPELAAEAEANGTPEDDSPETPAAT